MTNCLIQETGEVLFLDLDPGQKEFGLPGYLTLALLDKPLLGTKIQTGRKIKDGNQEIK